jgi:hypothetical protein
VGNRGPWVCTNSGRDFYLLDPQPEDIVIEDIAHSLAHQCRYNGHTDSFYSVAQHCVLLSQVVYPSEALLALMHDATEAYVGDVVAPLKGLIPNFKDIEARIWRCIVQAFPCIDYDEEGWARVAEYDRRICRNEAEHLFLNADSAVWGIGDPIPDTEGIISGSLRRPWNPHQAQHIFTQRFKELCCDQAPPTR